MAYRFLRFQGTEFDVRAIAAAIGQRTKWRSQIDLSSAIRETIDVITSAKPKRDQERVPSNHYLFAVARRLKAQLPIDQRSEDEAAKLAPLALFVADVLTDRGLCFSMDPSDEWINWQSDEEVTIAWETAWCKAKFAEGETLLSQAFLLADRNPILVKGIEGRYRTLINVAYHLQTMHSDQSIVLPVNEAFAAQLGVSKVCVGQFIERALRQGWLHLVNAEYSRAKQQARTFRFNYEKMAESLGEAKSA